MTSKADQGRHEIEVVNRLYDRLKWYNIKGKRILKSYRDVLEQIYKL